MSSLKRNVITATATAGLLVLAAVSAAVSASAAPAHAGHVPVARVLARPGHLPALPASARAGHAGAAAKSAPRIEDFLTGVSCMNPADCVAVGSTGTGFQPDTLTEQWNGYIWRVLEPSRIGQLEAVSCVSSGCMAVGSNYNSGGNGGVSIAQWWNGTSWRTVNPSSDSAGYAEDLDAVSCVSASYCVAVGEDVNSSEGDIAAAVEQTWNGRTWTDTNPPDHGEYAYLSGVSCGSTSSCLAVGDWNEGPNGGRFHAFADSWDGTSWHAADPHDPKGTYLNALSCPAAGDCMAVGNSKQGWLTQQWQDGNWQPLTTNGPTPAAPYGVTCLSVSDCLAVGDGAGTAALAEQWNGSTWQAMTPVNPSALGNGLDAVSCTSPGHCVAVGYYEIPPSYGPLLALAEVRSGSTWHIPAHPGYLTLQPDGAVSNFNVSWYGSPHGHLTGTAIALAADTATGGYWILTSHGGVDNYNAPWDGSEISDPNGTPAAIAADPKTGGYWILNTNGGVDNYHAPWYGSQRGQVHGKAISITADPKTGGYWILDSDGSVTAFHAPARGSEAGHLNGTPAALAASPSGSGYWILNTNGGVDNYHAPWYGSARGHLHGTATAIAPDPHTGGYWILASNGGVNNYHAPWYGSLAPTHPTTPPNAIAGL